MKSFINHKASKAIQIFLAAVMSITGSVGAVAAVPQAATVDWVDASVVQTETSEFVEIDAGWSSYDFDNIYSVQYRIDGKPVKSHELDEGVNFGDAILAIDADDDFELTIALCNSDGCTESDPVNVSISDDGTAEISFDTEAVPIIDATYHPISTADTNAASELDMVYQQYVDGLSQSEALWGTIASEIAKAALGSAVGYGVNLGLDAIMGQFGMGEQDYSEQFASIQGSLDTINAKIDKLTSAINELDNKVTWQGFLAQHDKAVDEIGHIYTSFDNVTGWVESGNWDRESWTGARQKVVDSISTLAGASSNGGTGVVDRTDGAIYQLMAATPQGVASADSYWPIIDQYRDFYRTAIAFGYLTLDLIDDHFDETGSTRIMADNALEAGRKAVFNMYSYGISPSVPMDGVDVLGYAQVRSIPAGVTSLKAAELDENVKRGDASIWFQDMFYDIQDHYNPANHDHMTIEEFFTSLNIPLSYARDAGGGWKGTGWEVNRLDDGTPHLGIPPLYEMKPPIHQVKEGNLVRSFQPLCGENGMTICGMYASDHYRTTNEDNVLNLINQRKAAIQNNGGFKLPDGDFAHTEFGYVSFTDRMNHAGWAANLDEDDVHLAAFGDGSSQLPVGYLPGAEEGSACIGLPDEPTRLMGAGDFHLRWQPDGNLTLRDADNNLKFVSKTRHNADQLCWQDDGNLVIYNGEEVTFESDTSDDALGGFGGRELKLTPDGQLQITNELNDVIWLKGVTN